MFDESLVRYSFFWYDILQFKTKWLIIGVLVDGGMGRGGFRHVQHVRPNREGPPQKWGPHIRTKKFLQRANIPKLPESVAFEKIDYKIRIVQ